MQHIVRHSSWASRKSISMHDGCFPYIWRSVARPHTHTPPTLCWSVTLCGVTLMDEEGLLIKNESINTLTGSYTKYYRGDIVIKQMCKR